MGGEYASVSSHLHSTMCWTFQSRLRTDVERLGLFLVTEGVRPHLSLTTKGLGAIPGFYWIKPYVCPK